jgi:hypothetical protein
MLNRKQFAWAITWIVGIGAVLIYIAIESPEVRWILERFCALSLLPLFFVELAIFALWVYEKLE